jgi:asparagine synthetase B (glutamine-hydrolysing)
MKKGFSLLISPNNILVNSFLSKEYDDLYFQSSSFDFLFEGVLLNKKKLLKEFALKDFSTLIQELYLTKKEQIIKLFEGEFRGFIFDRNQQKLFIFTNISSTQRVFYGTFEDKIYIDSDLKRLNKTLKNSGISTKPDLESLYQLLSFSNLPETKTPIQNIKKLLDAHYLEIDIASLKSQEIEYFNLAETPIFSGTKEKAIDQIHDIFSNSISLEYEKDTELGKDHLALLSGGLDSRVAMMYALKNNFIPGNALCFSQSNYFDHTISEKIAADYDIHYEFIPLDGGQFLKKIDELTEISEGMVFYTGGIHAQHAVDNMQYENFALFHSGQIGDGVLGGFNTEPRKKKPTYFKILETEQFLPKIKNSLDLILENYENEELFLLRNVAYNRTLLGAHVFQQKRYQTSPFMTKDFLKFAISLPEEWKFNHRFYIDWINKHCKEATKYRWERTLMKPDAKWKTTFGDKVIKRGYNILNNKILQTPQNSSMYPYQFYFESDAEIQNYYQKYFEENFYRIEKYPELSQDVFALFQAESFSLKSKAINILSIFKLYF